jgi:hypothetical protein
MCVLWSDGFVTNEINTVFMCVNFNNLIKGTNCNVALKTTLNYKALLGHEVLSVLRKKIHDNENL